MNIRCPHCHNPIEVIPDIALNDLSCPSCGSAFSLLGNPTLPYSPAKTLGRFELLEQVGMGRFGSVWKARDAQLDRNVAVKVPRATDLQGTDADQFFREARTAAQLRHANIVGVHEIGRDNNQVFIVSDFIDGVSLQEWLSAQRFTFREAAALCIKIARALHVAHEAGIVHRDLKPGNIMLDVKGEPHVTDFGLAKRDQGEITMTADGQVLGTPAYMAPEQARGDAHRVDCRADVYSLGVILFETLTGELPFRGELRMLLVQIQQDDPPRPRKLDSGIPRDLETICLKCLEKEPAKRYASAADLADDLQRALDGKPVHARPIGPVQRLWRIAKRQPVMACLWTALILSLIAGPTLAMVAAANERNRWVTLNGELVAAKKIAEAERNKANKHLENAIVAEKQAHEQRAMADASRMEAMEQARIAVFRQKEAQEARAQAEAAERESREAKNRELAQRVDATLPARGFSEQQIEFLRADVSTTEDLFRRVAALSDSGRQGGEAEILARASVDVHAAKARLAWASGDFDGAVRHYDLAVEAATNLVDAIQASHERASATLTDLADAHQRLTLARLCAAKAKDRLAASSETGKD